MGWFFCVLAGVAAKRRISGLFSADLNTEFLFTLMLTFALILLLCLGALALHIRPAQDPDPKPVGYNPVQGGTLRFLYAFIWSLKLRFVRLVNHCRLQAQIALLHIRQALATMHFGRGLLHS